MLIKPIRDRILIKPAPAETKTQSGLFIPDNAETNKPVQGEVIAVGSGKITKEGTIVALEVAPGDTVLYSKDAGVKTKDGNTEYLILNEDQILAIIK